MRPTTMLKLPIVLVSVTLVLAACGGGAAVSPTEDAPTTAAATSPPATVEATDEPMDTPEPAEEADAEVDVRSGAFAPTELTVPGGSTVAFSNSSSFAHTVTEGTGGQAAAGAMVDQSLGAGQVVTVTFDEPGTYDITCRFHPSMQMTVVVEG